MKILGKYTSSVSGTYDKVEHHIIEYGKEIFVIQLYKEGVKIDIPIYPKELKEAIQNNNHFDLEFYIPKAWRLTFNTKIDLPNRYYLDLLDMYLLMKKTIHTVKTNYNKKIREVLVDLSEFAEYNVS